MNRGLLLVPLLLALAAAVWWAADATTSRLGSDPNREVVEGRPDALEMPPSLVGTPGPQRAEADRAFPDLPPQEVPDGVGVIEPGDRDVCGRLVGPDGSSVVHGLVRAIDPRTGEELASVATNRTGRFWLRLAEPCEAVRIRAAPPRGAGPVIPRDFEDVSTGMHDLELELRAGAWVEGTVVDEQGNGVVAVVRWAGAGRGLDEGEWARTDDEGAFRIAVPPGECTLYADTRQRGLADSLVVEVRAPEAGVRIVCPPTRTVKGRVVGSELGEFEVHWRVLETRSDNPAGWVPVGPDGLFEVHEVPPGRVAFAAVSVGDPRTATATIDRPVSFEVELALGEGLGISGRLLSSTLDPEQLALVFVHVDHGIRYDCGVKRGGSFVVRGLAPGRYQVRALGAGREEWELPVKPIEAGAQDVELVLD